MACLRYAAAEDLSCLKSEEQGSGIAIAWYDVLKEQAHAALEARLARVELLKTDVEIRDYQREMRAIFARQLGDFPERVPLNSQVVGEIRREKFRIEKVIFDSQLRHRVTANLYIPAGQGPFPAVLVSSGHSRTAKTADYNQRYGIILAEYGMVALCIDPIGQGERSQDLTDEGKPHTEATTHEHLMIGTGSILVGRNTATYRVWDAMRAIDYLQSRAEVDPQRIGMAGCSGGGTMTSYVMALDERVTCAAPACYLTTFQELIATVGPQDAEQNIFAQVKLGLDHPDYVLMRAPKPTLISSTSADFFGIRGTWDNFRQCKRIYTQLGAPERVDLVEAAGTHGVQPANLAATAQWMQRWLVGKDSPVPVREFGEFQTLTEQELLCCATGQVLSTPGERSVYDLNAERAAQLAAARVETWKQLSRTERVAKITSALGIRSLAELPLPTSKKAGKVERADYHIDKLVIHTDSGVPLPALTFHPKDPHEAAYLYLHDGGKEADGAEGGAIEKIVKNGFVVVSVDLRGQGETAAGAADPKLGDWRAYNLAYLLGQSVVGSHTEDILAAADWIANYQSQTPREVHVVAVGRTGVAALHAAALYPERFSSLTIKAEPQTWTAIAGAAELGTELTTAVHGALAHYDLPDLIELADAAKLKYEAP